MKNKIVTFLLATALVSPTASLWASAGDAATQGPAGTTTGTPQPKSTVKKHHGGHRHKKSTASAAPSKSNTSSSSEVK